MSAQRNLSVLCKRLLAALSLALAATLAPLASEPASRSGVGKPATIDQALVAEVDGLIEDESRKHPDWASGVGHTKAYIKVAERDAAAPPPNSLRLSRDARSAPRTHAARSGLTRAPPLV